MDEATSVTERPAMTTGGEGTLVASKNMGTLKVEATLKGLPEPKPPRIKRRNRSRKVSMLLSRLFSAALVLGWTDERLERWFCGEITAGTFYSWRSGRYRPNKGNVALLLSSIEPLECEAREAAKERYDSEKCVPSSGPITFGGTGTRPDNAEPGEVIGDGLVYGTDSKPLPLDITVNSNDLLQLLSDLDPEAEGRTITLTIDPEAGKIVGGGIFLALGERKEATPDNENGPPFTQ